MNINKQSELLLKSRIFDVFEYIVGTRFSMEQRLLTTTSLSGDVVSARVNILLPDSQLNVLWLRVSVFSSGNIFFSNSTFPKPEVVSVSPDDEEELTEAIADVFSDFTEIMRTNLHVLS